MNHDQPTIGEVDQLTAAAYDGLRAATAENLTGLLRANGIESHTPAANRRAIAAQWPLAIRVAVDVLEQEVHRLTDLVNDYRSSAR